MKQKSSNKRCSIYADIECEAQELGKRIWSVPGPKGILRCGGRLGNAALSDSEKNLALRSDVSHSLLKLATRESTIMVLKKH